MNIKRINGISNSQSNRDRLLHTSLHRKSCMRLGGLIKKTFTFCRLLKKRKRNVKSAVKIVNALDIFCPLRSSQAAMYYLVALANLQSFYLLCPFCSTWSKDSSLSLPTFKAGLEMTKSFYLLMLRCYVCT